MERFYLDLDTSHRDLRESYKKMVKTEKKRDKFFNKLWKGVKGIIKVLKPNDQLHSPRLESDDEAPAYWLADDASGNGVKLTREDSS